MEGYDYYSQMQQHPIDPERVYIFKIKSQGEYGNWYVRIKREKYKSPKNRYFQKSLRTPHRHLAMEKAKAVYLSIINTETKGLEFKNKRLNSSFNEFLKDGLTAGPPRKKRFRNVYLRYWSEFFGDIELSLITTAKFNDYLRWRSNYWKNKVASGEWDKEKSEKNKGFKTYNIAVVPSTTTLKAETQMMKQFLYWCEEQEYISVVPKFKTKITGISGVVSSPDRRKSKALTTQMETAIERRLRDWCLTDEATETNWLKKFGKRRLYYFTYFARHTLIRPNTELTHIKWKDIEIMESKKHKGKQLALIRVTNAKGGKERMAVMPYGQVNLIYRWREHTLKFNEEIGEEKFGGLNDYVFPSYRGGSELVETHLIARLLRDRLKDWGLAQTEEGLSVTLYSIARHTGITRRIERSNWDVGRVATSAGTSIQQISRFYYEAFIRQNPDRWAMTYRNGKPVLSERKEYEQQIGLAKWEAFIDGAEE